MNFIYTEEFRFQISSGLDEYFYPKLVINRSGIVILTFHDIEYQYNILDSIPCKYHRFACKDESVKNYSNEDKYLGCYYDPALSLPIYCWFSPFPDFLKLQRKIEEVIEGQRLAKFAEYDLRICYMV